MSNNKRVEKRDIEPYKCNFISHYLLCIFFAFLGKSRKSWGKGAFVFLKKKKISIKLMQLKVGNIFKVPVCKAPYDIARCEQKKFRKKRQGRKILVLSQ